MKYTRWLILAALAALSVALAPPAAAGRAQTSCHGIIADMTIVGDVVVPERVYCELDNVTVLGHLRVAERSTAALYDSRLAGGIAGVRFEAVLLQNSSAGGDLQLTGGVTAWIEGATVAGDVRLVDNLDTRLNGARLERSLTVLRSRSQVQFCGVSVGGDARFAGNEGWVTIGGDSATCAANQVGGTLRVQRNLQETTVANNTVGGDLICAANAPAPLVFGNQVRGATRGQCVS